MAGGYVIFGKTFQAYQVSWLDFNPHTHTHPLSFLLQCLGFGFGRIAMGLSSTFNSKTSSPSPFS